MTKNNHQCIDISLRMIPTKLHFVANLSNIDYTLNQTFSAALFQHKGSRFILGFIENSSTLPQEIYIISQSVDNVVVRIRAPLDPTFAEITSVVSTDKVKRIALPSTVRMKKGEVTGKGECLRHLLT